MEECGVGAGGEGGPHLAGATVQVDARIFVPEFLYTHLQSRPGQTL